MGSRHKQSYEEMLTAENHSFRGKNIRAMLKSDAAYAEFVKKYWDYLQEKKRTNERLGRPITTPKEEDINLFYDFNEGKLDYAALRKAWGSNCNFKLGQILTWVHYQQKKEGENGKSNSAGSKQSSVNRPRAKKGNGR